MTGARTTPATGLVTIARGRHTHLQGQVASLAAGSRRPDQHVVVAMGDPALEHLLGPAQTVVHLDAGRQLPLAAARNRGAEVALAAGAEVLVFLDVDCLAGRELVAGYAAAVADDPGTVWSGPVTYLPPPGAEGYDVLGLDRLDAPHRARPAPAPGERLPGRDPDLFWSLSFAVHADTWRAVGGFHEGYQGYGAEDTDFGRLVLRSGHRLGWVGDARAYHQHHPTADPPVQHLHDILRNGRTYRDRWGHWPMRGWLDAFDRLGLVEKQGEDYVPVDSLRP